MQEGIRMPDLARERTEQRRLKAGMSNPLLPDERHKDPLIARVDHSRTFAEQAYAQLKHALIVGGLAPGQRLPLRSLCTQLGTSVTPIREALLRLTTASALEGYAHHAIRVPVLTRADLDELKYLRLDLECLALRHAKPDIRRAKEMRRLHFLVHSILASPDVVEFATAVRNLRASILCFGHDSILSTMIDQVWCRFGPTFTQSLTGPSIRHQLVAEYADIIAAIGRGDPTAAEQALVREIHASFLRPRANFSAERGSSPPLAPDVDLLSLLWDASSRIESDR
jgi:GntR family transcriptional regulator, colanic acid and biofilm gene transcriptional regulator